MKTKPMKTMKTKLVPPKMDRKRSKTVKEGAAARAPQHCLCPQPGSTPPPLQDTPTRRMTPAATGRQVQAMGELIKAGKVRHWGIRSPTTTTHPPPPLPHPPTPTTTTYNPPQRRS